MKKIITVLLVVGLVFVIVGCDAINEESTVEEKASEQTVKNMEEMQRQVGQPNIDDFYEKKLLKRIYELRDNSDLITYSYTRNRDGKFVYLGKSIGYGIPMSVQFTSPERRVDVSEENVRDFEYGNGYGDYKMPQPEPNGLYMPNSMSATWVVLVNEDGSNDITYFESDLTVKQSKLPKRLCADWSLPEDY